MTFHTNVKNWFTVDAFNAADMQVTAYTVGGQRALTSARWQLKQNSSIVSIRTFNHQTGKTTWWTRPGQAKPAAAPGTTCSMPDCNKPAHLIFNGCRYCPKHFNEMSEVAKRYNHLHHQAEEATSLSYAKDEQLTVECLTCGEEFHPQTRGNSYCSSGCLQQSYRDPIWF